MKAGALDKRITVQTPTITQDTMGQPVTSWATLAQRWASVEPLQGREAQLVHALFSEATHKISMRYLSGLNAKCRVSWDSRYFNILSVINSREADVEHICVCVEVG